MHSFEVSSFLPTDVIRHGRKTVDVVCEQQSSPKDGGKHVWYFKTRSSLYEGSQDFWILVVDHDFVYWWHALSKKSTPPDNAKDLVKKARKSLDTKPPRKKKSFKNLDESFDDNGQPSPMSNIFSLSDYRRRKQEEKETKHQLSWRR